MQAKVTERKMTKFALYWTVLGNLGMYASQASEQTMTACSSSNFP